MKRRLIAWAWRHPTLIVRTVAITLAAQFLNMGTRAAIIADDSSALIVDYAVAIILLVIASAEIEA